MFKFLSTIEYWTIYTEEKNRLISDIWRFVVHENKQNYQNYISKFEIATKAIEGMKKSKEIQEQYRKTYE
jgi:hypothetical protein